MARPWTLVAAAVLLAAAAGTAVPAPAAPAAPGPGTALAAVGPDSCSSVPSTADPSVLRTVYRTGKYLQVDAKVMLAGFEAGWVESHLNDLPCGDLDSLGVFQQRSSWGTVAQRLDVAYASTQFFVRAKNVDAANPGYTAGQVAQKVQVSAHPERYDQAQGTAQPLLGQAQLMFGRLSQGTLARTDAGNRLTYLETGAGGDLALGWQQSPGSDPWLSADPVNDPAAAGLLGPVVGRPASALDVSGKLTYVARTPDGQLRHGWQDSAGSGTWLQTVIPPTTDLDGVTTVTVAGDPAEALDANGRLTYFARTTDGALLHGWQDTPGSGPWHATLIRDADTGALAHLTGDPAVSLDYTGKLTFFARTDSGELLHGWQDAPGTGPWHTTTITDADSGAPVHLEGRPAVSQDVTGKLCFFARTAAGQLVHGWQDRPGTGPWHWITIPPTTDLDGVTTVTVAGDPAAALDANGKLTYLVRASDGTLLHGWQDTPGLGPWHATLLRDNESGQQVHVAGDPAESQDVSGKLTFFARTSDGTLLHGWQDAPGTGPWHTTVLPTDVTS